MDKKKRKIRTDNTVVAPGMDPEDSYGERATKFEIEKGESTTVTRVTYDEYDPSDR
ncbi:hypothetical protein [Oceanobacillus jordanicus]|uniref:DUF4025 domain-containing protein n=1 Tax=Oceanobacillus jordanicus TaxID=2867266 RepID=A0AAW5B776_9BACI|nr:hypothetical protein [Oceanobacillus jordanicus]MCG3420052.1 hypothetical protein [Oceanobacillus jordanicus]